ncbi:MAG: hypothetical protein U0414_34730 [Polyangiaceae bacterium]
MRGARVLAITLALAALGCSRKRVDATPEGAVREFTERIGRTGPDPTAAKMAYELLSKSNQENLAERAKRYRDASGKNIRPEEMIAPQSYLERFKPHEFKSKIVGSRALVTIVGADPSEVAEIPCVSQDGGWRVDLPLPALIPVAPNHRSE